MRRATDLRYQVSHDMYVPQTMSSFDCENTSEIVVALQMARSCMDPLSQSLAETLPLFHIRTPSIMNFWQEVAQNILWPQVRFAVVASSRSKSASRVSSSTLL